MTYFDCFNGDADGICALTQLRRHTPRNATLVTGVKRDISLLKQIVDKVEPGDVVTVLDVSMDKNKSELDQILAAGAKVFYCDHHFAGEIPTDVSLECIINTTANVCTSLLINQHLNSDFLGWGVVGTFGDNLDASATSLAKPLGLTQEELTQFKNLGVYLNYNGYGAALADLYFHPADLYQKTAQYDKPEQFINEDKDTYNTLEQGYYSDMQNAQAVKADFSNEAAAVFVLPDAPWARRVSGVYGNELANQHVDRAHAVVTQADTNNYLISVRAPLNNKKGADEICRQFATGGGRAAAAGINALPKSELPKFIDTLAQYYS